MDTSLPYGDGLSCTGADTNQLHFTGKERDQESTNDYFLARYYASNTAGRFLTADFSGTPQAMPYADLSNPQSFNRYVYLNDNPVGGVDADGHQTTDNNGKTCGADNVKDHLTHGQADALCANATTSAGTKQQAQTKPAKQSWAGSHPRTIQAAKGTAKLVVGFGLVGTVAFGDVPGSAAGAAIVANAILGGTTTAVSGVVDIGGAATNSNTDDVDNHLDAVGNGGGLVTTVASGGNLQAGQTAATLTDAATIAASPRDAFKNVFTGASTLSTGVKLFNMMGNYFVSPGLPPMPAPPSPPNGWDQQ